MPLGMEDPAASGDKHKHERPQQLREQPAVLELGIVELIGRTELEHQQTLSPRQVVSREIWMSLNRHVLSTGSEGRWLTIGHGKGQETDAASELHSLGSRGGPEFLIDVLDMRLDGRTGDTELGTDRSERSIRGKERQDARLGWRQ